MSAVTNESGSVNIPREDQELIRRIESLAGVAERNDLSNLRLFRDDTGRAFTQREMAEEGRKQSEAWNQFKAQYSKVKYPTK